MNTLKTFLISSVTATLLILGVFYYLPYEIEPIISSDGMLGATISTIAGSDTISGSRTLINNNFSALNSAKIEISTTTLPNITTLANLATVGTISSGVWHGTTLTVAYGGTGSTTLLSNAILLGNGTGVMKAVSGLGTAGQTLTSNGAGAAPSWQSGTVNETLDYTWTGNHHFNTGSSTFNGITEINGLSFIDNAVIASTSLPTPTKNSNAATKYYSDTTILTYTASDNAKVAAPTERNTAETAYTLVKDVAVYGAGTVRVGWQMKGSDDATVYGKIYLDGIAYGTEKQAGSVTYATSSEATIYVAPGTHVQLYIKAQSGKTCYIKSFYLYWDESASTGRYYTYTN